MAARNGGILIVKQFLDGKHDRKLADIVSTPVATVSKVLKENYYWGCAEMMQEIIISA